MRLAYLDPHPVPGNSPEALQILQNVDSLGTGGIFVSLVTPEPVGETNPMVILGRKMNADVELVHLPDWRRCWLFKAAGLGRSSRPFQFQVRNWLRQHRVDALLIRNLKLADTLITNARHLPIFFESHELFAQTYREDHPRLGIRERRKLAILEARERRVYASARGLIVLTSLLRDDIRESYGTRTPIIIAPDGVDLVCAAQARGKSPGNVVPILLYLGSLHPWKGVETAVQAMTSVTGARLRIVGGGDARIAELKSLCHSLNITDRVELSGSVPPEKRFATIDAADICLLPLNLTSIGARYTSPLKLFEYMAMGKPIVASNLPALRTVLSDRENALLVEPGSPRALANAITTLLADPVLASRIANAAYGRAKEKFGWEVRSAQIRKFIHDATN